MAEGEVPAHYEDLAQIEEEFDGIETEMIRKQYVLTTPVYAKRQAIIAKIENFWPLVFEAAPPEIDHYLQPTDSEIFAKSLTGLDVKRFEIAESNGDSGEGDPRSVAIRFEFSENDWFTDSVLEKKFWYRRSAKGWSGLVSEPVKINWKKGKDTTHGLMNAAIKLWEARQKAGDMNKSDLPEHKALGKLLENWNGENTSFFTWFAFVSAGPYVTAEESAKVTKEMNEKKQNGGTIEIPEIDEEEIAAMEDIVEVHEAGDDLANLLADDLWPGAIKYFTQAQEMGEMGDMSDIEFEDMDEDDDSDSGPIDIRSLVQAAEPPKKKQKK